MKNLSNEIWKDVKGYEGLYQVSNLGRVKSLSKKVKHLDHFNIRPERILKQGNSRGYSAVTLQRNLIRFKTGVHRLVALAFIPNPESRPQVNHINGIKNDNRVENLEWCTASENVRHGFEIGIIKSRMTSEITKRAQIASKNKCSVKVINTLTGEVFNSITDAALSIGRQKSFLSKKLNGTVKNNTVFEYY